MGSPYIVFLFGPKVKIKYLRGAFFGVSDFSEQIFHAPRAKIWHYATELRTLLCGSALTNTTDNLSEMCPLKLADFFLFLYHQSYIILQGPLIPPMDFTNCPDWGSNLLLLDGRAITLTTHPIRIAYKPVWGYSYRLPQL